MIRTTEEAPFLCLWRDANLLREMLVPERLTTARYEPVLRRLLGSGQLDLLFESGASVCVASGIQLDPLQLITREKSPFIWPQAIAAVLEPGQLTALESAVLPWLRSIARARPMASEMIRRFVPSERFERARAAGFAGAAPLETSIVNMAPFVYARRFAAGKHVVLACAHASLGRAVLADVVRSVHDADDARPEVAFAREWYGLTMPPPGPLSAPDVLITDRDSGLQAAIVLDLMPREDAALPVIDVPTPVPWDLLFSYDGADAPTAARFSVRAPETPLRPVAPLTPARIVGGSSGTIVLAVSAEALAMRGADIEEAEVLGRRLAAEGFRAHLTTRSDDPLLAGAQLVHIFGSPFEPHTAAFAEVASARGIDYVFDLPPRAADPSPLLESALSIVFRAARDRADVRRYLEAYERGKLDPVGLPLPTVEDFAALERRFLELSSHAAALLAMEVDLESLRATLPPTAAGRLGARGVFAVDEVEPLPIGHLVPDAPFALAHGPICSRSHLLYAALAAERLSVPFVVAGSVYDVEYLQTVRGAAPNAIVFADADARTVAALYRRAAVWVDVTPRPRSAAALYRAVACGALPVIAAESPLARIAGPDAASFSLMSLDDCARVMRTALAPWAGAVRIAALQSRLSARRDPTAAFGDVIAAYSRVASRA